MGLYQNTYIGAYLVLKNQKQLAKVNLRTCSNKDCDNYGERLGHDMKFCSLCGAEIKCTTVEKERFTHWYALVDEMGVDEDLLAPIDHPEVNVPKETQLLLENLSANYIDTDEAVDLSMLNPRELKDDFKEKYKLVIDYLQKNGFDFYINFGVVNYVC